MSQDKDAAAFEPLAYEQDLTSEAAPPALQQGVGYGTENPSSRPICLERPILKTKWHREGERV